MYLYVLITLAHSFVYLEEHRMPNRTTCDLVGQMRVQEFKHNMKKKGIDTPYDLVYSCVDTGWKTI